MDGREERMKKVRWENRKTSVLKKGRELATLCDIRLCVVTVSPDGTWPENAGAVKAVLHDAIKTAAEKQRGCPRKQQQLPEMMISTEDYDVQEVPEYNGERRHHHQFQDQWTQSDGFTFGAAGNDFQGGGMMPPPPQGSAGGVFDPPQQYDSTGYGNFQLGDYNYY